MMARLRSASAVAGSMALIIMSISSTDSTSGSARPSRGVSRSIEGSLSVYPALLRNLKNVFMPHSTRLRDAAAMPRS
jgi:hypothetical protein